MRYNKFHKGNVSEPETFSAMIKDVNKQFSANEEVPVVVMDAGIATEGNLELLRSDEYRYDYVCVNRTTPKEYDEFSENTETISDNRGNKIELTKADVKDKPDNFLHIKSQQKQKKEKSIDETNMTINNHCHVCQ